MREGRNLTADEAKSSIRVNLSVTDGDRLRTNLESVVRNSMVAEM